MAKYQVKVNDIENFQALCQTVYDETVGIINQAEQNINLLKNSTDLKDELIDGKQKYANAVHNFIGDKDRAIGRRIEIAKLLSDLIKNQGNIVQTLNNAENNKEVINLSLSDFKRQLKEEEEKARESKLY